MADRKPPFAALPTRALWDNESTALDLRVLACVCWHDRLSKNKRGGGCYAANRTMAAEVGCTITSLSRSLSRLAAFGYIERDRRGVPGKRHLTVYRVNYDPADVKIIAQRGKDHLPTEAIDEPQSFARGDQSEVKSFARADLRNGGNLPTARGQETSLREGIDSVETEGINSSEDARLAARDVVRVDDRLSDDANLAILDRAIRRGWKVAGPEWHAWLESLDPTVVCTGAHIHRLIEELWAVAVAEDLSGAPGSIDVAGEKGQMGSRNVYHER